MASLGNAASPRQLGCRIIWDPWDAQSEQAGAGFEIEIVAALRQTLRSPLQHRCGQVGAGAIHHWPGSATSTSRGQQTCTSEILELPCRRTGEYLGNIVASVVCQAQHISQENEDMYCTVQTHHKSSLPTRPTERRLKQPSSHRRLGSFQLQQFCLPQQTPLKVQASRSPRGRQAHTTVQWASAASWRSARSCLEGSPDRDR